MKYAALCAALGAALLVCTAAYDYVSGDTVFRSRLDEKAAYAELNADMNRKFGGYSIEELCSGYSAPEVFLGKTEIKMDVLNQYPELPVGCEITCAAAMLNFFGFDIDKCELADNYFPKDSTFTEHDGTLYGPDPWKEFVGDPYGKGYGCYETVVADVITDYFSSHGSQNRGVVLKNAESTDLERLIDGGAPVIVWASIDMKPYKYNAVSHWVTESGEDVEWLSNSHTLILTGYDASYYYFMDCSDKSEIQRYAKETFVSRWKENGSRAAAVKIG